MNKSIKYVILFPLLTVMIGCNLSKRKPPVTQEEAQSYFNNWLPTVNKLSHLHKRLQEGISVKEYFKEFEGLKGPIPGNINRHDDIPDFWNFLELYFNVYVKHNIVANHLKELTTTGRRYDEETRTYTKYDTNLDIHNLADKQKIQEAIEKGMEFLTRHDGLKEKYNDLTLPKSSETPTMNLFNYEKDRFIIIGVSGEFIQCRIEKIDNRIYSLPYL